MEKLSSNKQGTTDMTVGSPAKNILYFTIPLIIGNLFQLLYNWTDAIIIGQSMGPSAFGSLSASLPVINLLVTVTLGFMTGAGVLLGQLFGAKDFDRLKKSLSTTIIFLLIGSVFLMFAGAFLSRPLLQLLNVSEQQIDASTQYLTIYFLGIICMVFYNAFAQILRSVGNSTLPLVVLIIGTIINVGLDLLFVLVFRWGIMGAAFATVISQGISAIVCFIYIQLKFPLLRLSRKTFKFDKDLFKSIIKLAVPSMIQQFCASVGFIAINALINKNGPDFTTAFGLGNRIDELVSLQFMSFGISISTYAAQNKGVNDYARIKKGLRSSLAMSLSFYIVFGALLMIFRQEVIQIFMSMNSDLGGDPQMVLNLTSEFLIITLPAYVVLTIMLLISGLLRGVGDAVAAMNVNIVSLIFRVIAAFILNHYFGYIGVFFASPVGWLAGATYSLIRYFGGKWKKGDVLNSNPSQNLVN